MITHKKAPATTQRFSQKSYPKYKSTPTNYHGRFNRIPPEKEIVDDWWGCLEFFKEREHLHQKTASWYFNYSREMEAKASKHLDLAEIAHAKYSHYLDLIGMAVINGGSSCYAR